MNFTNITNLNHSPILKSLLVNYVLTNYEENAIVDDDHLMMEYKLLKRSNQLHLLFECEAMNNYFEECAKTNAACVSALI